MRKPRIATWCIAMTLGMLSPVYSQDYLQKYSDWSYDKVNDRYFCEYHFNGGQNTPVRKQQVIYYPQMQKNNWLYFYNPEKKAYWGRCATPQHPQYDTNQMQWSYLKDKKWSDLSVSCPTIPGVQNGPEIIPPPLHLRLDSSAETDFQAARNRVKLNPRFSVAHELRNIVSF